jgi:hypothetical protein
MIIGNIITKSNIVVDDYYNITSDIEVNNDLPTIVVGWEDFLKDDYNDLDFIDRKIDENLFWTFSKKEKRDLHNEDLYYFEQHCINKLLLNIKYYYVDYLLFSEKKLKKILIEIKKYKNILLITDDMFYLYSNNIIFGFNKNVIQYVTNDIDKLENFLKKYSTIIEDDRNYSILNNIENNKKYIPYMYFLENFKNNN